MANCHACSANMGEKDRFCRQCGAPVATLVGDLIDTWRFSPDAAPSAAAERRSGVLTNPFQVTPPAPVEQGSSPLYQTASVQKRLRKSRVLWLLAKTSSELARRIQAARPRSKVVIKFYRGTTEQTVEMILGHLW